MPDVRDINLLPYEERSQERFEHLAKRLSLISVICLVTVAIFTLGTLIFFTSLASKRSALIGRVETGSNTINTYKSSEELMVVIKNKVSAADKILSARVNYPKVFDTFSQLVPQGVYFNDIKFSAGKMIVSGKAKTSADIAGLVSSLLSPKGVELISEVNVESLSSDEKGIYSFVLSGQLSKK